MLHTNSLYAADGYFTRYIKMSMYVSKFLMLLHKGELLQSSDL